MILDRRVINPGARPQHRGPYGSRDSVCGELPLRTGVAAGRVRTTVGGCDYKKKRHRGVAWRFFFSSYLRHRGVAWRFFFFFLFFFSVVNPLAAVGLLFIRRRLSDEDPPAGDRPNHQPKRGEACLVVSAGRPGGVNGVSRVDRQRSIVWFARTRRIDKTREL